MSLVSLVSYWRRLGRPSRRPMSRGRKLLVEVLEDRMVLDNTLGATPSTSFVTGLYHDLMHRAPRADEVASWVGAMDRGMDRGQVVRGFVGSSEFRGGFIVDNYQTLLDRTPDASAVNSWLTALQTGQTREQATVAFLTSDEYFRNHGGTAAGFLAGLYEDVLDRAPDAGFAGWLDALQHGLPARSAAISFVQGTEHHTQIVTAAFHNFLDRAPDSVGLASWVGQLGRGLSWDSLTVGIAGSQEYVDNQVLSGPGLVTFDPPTGGTGGTGGSPTGGTPTGGTPTGGTGGSPTGGIPTGDTPTGGTSSLTPEQLQYLTRLYTDLLHRQPQPNDLASWGSAFARGATFTQVANSFTSSTEYQGNQIRALYRAYLGREAEAGAVNSWLAWQNAGAGEDRVEAAILASAEFYYQHGNTDQGWLRGLYGVVLGRGPDAGGFDSWINGLQGGLSRGAAALSFVTSAEARGWAVGDAYNELLRRNPAPGEVASSVESLAHNAPARFVAGVVGSAEYASNSYSLHLISLPAANVTGVSGPNGVLSAGATVNHEDLTVTARGITGQPVVVFANGVSTVRSRFGRDGSLQVRLPGGLTDGRQALTARPIDGTNTFRFGSGFTVTIDRAGPELTLKAPPSTVSYTPQFTLQLSEAEFSQTLPDVRVDLDLNNDGDFNDPGEQDHTAVMLAGETTTFTLNPLPDGGDYTARVRAADLLGNEAVGALFHFTVAFREEVGGDPAPFVPPGEMEDLGGNGGALPSFDGPMIPEVESNDTLASAMALTLPTRGRVVVSGTITNRTDLDFFSFTVGQRTGIFVDIDARENRLSQLNSELRLFDASGTLLESNDNGYDFDSGFPSQFGQASPMTGDSALYFDLNPGTYVIRVSAINQSGGAYQLHVTTDTDYSNIVPALNSLPGASDTMFLDFNGHSSSTDLWADPAGTPANPNDNNPYTMKPFSLDDNLNEFTPAEKLAIRNIWRAVAEDYSAFNINVSTTYAGMFSDRTALRVVITPDGQELIGLPPGVVLGVAFLNSYNRTIVPGIDDNICFTFTDLHRVQPGFGGGFSGDIMAVASNIGATVSHEFGHTLGFLHIPTTSVVENPPLEASTMSAVSLGMSRYIWRRAVNTNGLNQDEMAIAANMTNSFGYRADDHSNTSTNATLLTATAFGPTSNVFLGTGVIGDVVTDSGDFFRFSTSSAAPTIVTADVSEFINNLDVGLRVFDTAGNLIASSFPRNSFDAQLILTLPDGDYFAEVTANGQPGNSGQYALIIFVPADNGGGGGAGVPLPDDRFELNDTSDQSTNLGVLGGGQKLTLAGLNINQHANGLVDYDWYRLAPGQNGTFTATITYQPNGPTGDLHLRLFTVDGAGQLVQLATSRNVGTTTQQVSVKVGAGQPLLLWIYGFDRAQATYDLTLTLT